jgi:CRISPR-associated protein Cas5d
MAASQVPLGVRVWGELACFTRPEMKVERVTYPVPTPSAARGILEAILWKPEFTWLVQEIWILNPVKYFSILRNEVNSRASERAAASWKPSGGGYEAPSDRAQRHTLALRDVDYVLRAQIALKPGVAADPAKYRDQFRRRVERGRSFSTPYFGCREFAASFREPIGDERPLRDWTEDLGPMLHDIDYAPDRSGRGVPRFFQARVEQGVIRIPHRAFDAAGG